ncbi:hypothetical protein V6N13_031506 [Hibiscus sabdariffa]|uniref:WRKY domain-containing protein n=1 Tax=Hibiscus sabdariffa TaxID=183260 RepID=A0ABR2CK63_9ROSI
MQKLPFKGQDVSTNPSEGDLKGTNTATGTTRTSEDGYNWRKYGQKQVKGRQQFKDNATRFHGIKQELKDDNHYDPCLPIADHESTTLSSSSIFQLAAGNFPS